LMGKAALPATSLHASSGLLRLGLNFIICQDLVLRVLVRSFQTSTDQSILKL
jgi:hypothetical protein